MTPLLVSVLLALTAPAAQESRPIPKDSVEVEARGCLKGRVFTGTPAPDDEGTRRGPDIAGRHFRVSGPREVMDQVKEHNGHLVQLVGVVRKSALDDQGVGMRVGRGARVVIGAPTSDPTRTNMGAAAPSVPVMDVTVIRLLSEKCPIG
jgi:hypothetical protein